MDLDGLTAKQLRTDWSQHGKINIPGLVHPQTLPEHMQHHPTAQPKLLIIMVGLPARGKSYIAKKLSRYLNWLQYPTRVFNVGNRRRFTEAPEVLSTYNQQGALNRMHHDATLFDPACTETQNWRDGLAIATLDELLDWLRKTGNVVGILDATNSTVKRRRLLLNRLRNRSDPRPDVLFLESVCEDPMVLDRNMRLKLSGPDYRSQAPDVALGDLQRRIGHYVSAYVPLGKEEVAIGVPFVRMFDTGRQVTVHKVRSFLSMVGLDYLLSFHLERRQIWLTCNGQSIDDAQGKIGRQSDLTEEGVRFSIALAQLVCSQSARWSYEGRGITGPSLNGDDTSGRTADDNVDGPRLGVWTSMMNQSIQTAQGFPQSAVIKMSMLDDLGAGDMRGMTFDEIFALYPDVAAARATDIVHFRWPGVGGEGYVDVINRLRNVVLELERSRDHILVISHRAIVRVLLTYFMGLDKSQLFNLHIPKGSLFCVEPGAYCAKVQKYSFEPQKNTFLGPDAFEVSK